MPATTAQTSTIKIISGGQTGVDQAALAAARAAGLATGGWMPRHFHTATGPRPDLGAAYGLVECQHLEYTHRTEMNVRAADVTLRLAKTFSSPGERLTLKLATRHRKPHLGVRWLRGRWCTPADVIISWLLASDVNIVNVAGNSEETAPGIGASAELFLTHIFVRWSAARGAR